MDSWWDLGEWIGEQGDTLAKYAITCPFCRQAGNFRTAYHAEKKHQTRDKTLNFDTLECTNCMGYVMVLWSASSMAPTGLGGLHAYKVLPWPDTIDKFPEHWPEPIGRYWLQAKRSLAGENWDAAAVMIRSALQLALREHNAKGRTLKDEINDLASQGILPPLMKEWATNVRELGNDAAHPQIAQQATDPKDAKDVAVFLDFLLEYLYNLPYRMKQYRNRPQSAPPAGKE